MKISKETKRNVRAIELIMLGVALLLLGGQIYSFRFQSGWEIMSFLPTFVQVLLSLIIVFLEWGIAIAGLIWIATGAYCIYYNSKKITR